MSTSPPQYSPDGRWWWTGEQWVAVPPPQRRGGVGTIVGALCIFALIIFIVSAAGSAISKSSQREQEFRDRSCAMYGYCDE